MKITLVERHTYKPSHPDFVELSRACFLSKNLYNATLYAARQGFFDTGKLRRYFDLNKEFTAIGQPDYVALPRKVSKMVQQLVDKSVKSYWGLLRAFKAGKLPNKPGLPKYLPKDGRQAVTYTKQAISIVRQGFVKPSGTSVFIPTKQTAIQFVRLVPSRVNKNIIVEVGYERDCKEHDPDGKEAAIDLGINNLATLVFTDRMPIIYNGRPLKSINQFYNKRLAELKSKQDLSNTKRKTTNRIKRLHDRRYNKVKDYMHKVSRAITNQLVSSGVSTLAVGYNSGWKQDVNLGREINQKFVQIPFQMLLDMLTYKCALEGIRVAVLDEAYTSKCSFLDDEPVGRQDVYLGYRQKRGLFKSRRHGRVNADVNGAFNILKKYLQGQAAWDAVIHRNCVEVCSAPSVFTVKYKHVS